MSGRLTGRGVLVWLVAFFGIVIAVNSYFIAVSSRTFSGEDEQKPYLQGENFNRMLARHAEQAALGWKAAIGASRLANGEVRIYIEMQDRAGRPVAKAGLVGELRHPTNENRDRSLQLTELRPGFYQGQLAGVSTGYWEVLIYAAGDRIPFDAERRVWVR